MEPKLFGDLEPEPKLCTKSEPEPKINNFGSATLEKNITLTLPTSFLGRRL